MFFCELVDGFSAVLDLILAIIFILALLKGVMQTAEEIAKNLKGIGVAIAQRIVLRGQQQGPYQNFDQLKAVSGVGVAKIVANRDKISFE